MPEWVLFLLFDSDRGCVWTRTANAQNLEADMLKWLHALFNIFSGNMIDPDG